MNKINENSFPVEGLAASDISFEQLLSKTAEEKANVEINRVKISYNDMPEYRDKLNIKKNSSRKQYASIYFIRYEELSPIVLNAAKVKWNTGASHVDKILEVKPDTLCYIVGTVYMEMQYKPNILAEVSRDDWEPIPPPREKYYSDTDEIWLEDDSGRIKLVGDSLKKEVIISGIIMAALGKENSQGDFEILDICFAGLPEQINTTVRMDADDDDKYVALISGMNLDTDGALETRLQLMLEYLTGGLGSFPEQQNFSSKISRIIIAGNSLAEVKVVPDDKKQKKYGYDNSSYDAEPRIQLDNFLEKLCSLLPTHMMPGNHDPADFTLPQQPIHPNLLPKVGRNPNFHGVTNPYWCELDDVVFLGTSGQTIDDMYKYIESEDRIAIAERTLYWRHIAPSAPDTLWCYPFERYDPFIINQMPHVYFIGNQKEFATSLIEGPNQQRTRIILLPSFSESGVVVLLNLKNLKCHTTCFK
ncbi:14690_t:CDS:10 [Funneliformis caledonium]|uniref:DNA-directed DNA polymerase n=1 Tax=Funneliformis caledonium TaxID=1117310 RepID=A0A9N8VJG0_9GLOM|nr:14690_t:CDS:10 [Funneliformis caledonium]